MLKNGVECCDECEAPLPSYSGRTLDDELLCGRCYEKKSKSLRWLLVKSTASVMLALVAIAAFVVTWCLPIPGGLFVKVPIFGSMLVGIAHLRPHLVAIAKDILMRKKPRG